MHMTENIPENTSHTSRNRNIRFIAQCLLLYASCFLLYYGTSTGQDVSDVSLAMRQLTDAAVLCRTADQWKNTPFTALADAISYGHELGTDYPPAYVFSA